MLNEGEKCRKTTYYSIMNNALPTWGKVLLCFRKLTLQSLKDF